MIEFLSKNIELEEYEVPILNETDDTPAFTVLVKDITQREFRELQDVGHSRLQTMEDIIIDWRGLTVDNWNTIVRSDKKLVGDPTVEIPFSQEANEYIIANSWPSEYVDVVFVTLKDKFLEKEEQDEFYREELIQYIEATYRPKAPKDCEGCERQMGDSDECFFHHQWQYPECPYQRLSREPELIKLISFIVKSMDSWDAHDETPTRSKAPISGGGPVVKEIKQKKKNYGISVEKFEWACRLYQIKPDDALTALSWVGTAVQAANDAGEIEIKKLRKERFSSYTG